MSEGQEIPACRVWVTLAAEGRQEVVQELNRIFKEMFDVHFRFDPTTASDPSYNAGRPSASLT